MLVKFDHKIHIRSQSNWILNLVELLNMNEMVIVSQDKFIIYSPMVIMITVK